MASEFLVIAERVLRDKGSPMTAREIVEIAHAEGLFSDKRCGKTPWQTMKARLSEEIRSHGDRSLFVRTRPGRFFLREHTSPDRVYRARRFSPGAPDEKVLTVEQSLCARYLDFQGVVTRWKRRLTSLLSRQPSYTPRVEAELREDRKQMVTYILVTRRGRLLSFRRGRYSRVADFLRGSLCVGFGGHVTESDRSLFPDIHGLFESARRELVEELRLPAADLRRVATPGGLQIVGLLNDDSSPVGRRHFAVVMRYECSGAPDWEHPRSGERSVTQLRWISPGKQMPSLDEFEYWSQLCLTEFFSPAVIATPAFRVVRRAPFRARRSAICVLGEVGSGKSEVTSVLCARFQCREINSGKVLARLLRVPPIPVTDRAVFQAKAHAFIASPDGAMRLGKALARQADAERADRVVIDGIRQPETMKALERLLEGRSVARIYVYANPAVAFQFFRMREGERPFAEFMATRNAKAEEGVRDMIAESDAVIYNWSGRRRLSQVVARLMKELGL